MPNGPDYLKLFHAARLNPNLPDHKKMIDSYIAMYAVQAPEKASELRGLYEKVWGKAEEPVVKTEEVVEPKKRGRKPKSTSTDPL